MEPSRLRDRLREIVRPRASDPQPPQSVSYEPRNGAGRSTPPLEEVLGGGWRDVDGSASFVVTRRFDADRRYGCSSVGERSGCLLGDAPAAAIVAGSSARGPFLFLDLETSGLSGGAGTYAFLVGYGWFEQDGVFVTEQHLLTDVGRERSMLQAVAVALRRAGSLVTFNGKSFDAPVLDTRYLFHRLDAPCGLLPHVDVLHPARRFWGGTAELGCSLVALEEQQLGVRRVDDVPGFEIPSRYFQFVRSGDPRPLAGVFEHNRRDLLSLAALTSELFHLVEAGPAAARTGREALGLGRVYERAEMADRAQEAFVRALDLAAVGSPDHTSQIEALRALARDARRRRQHELAASRWHRLLDLPRCPPRVAREAIEALAIHHEHRVRDLAVAKRLVLRGLEIDGTRVGGDAARHRLARIERKIVSERPLFPSLSSPPSSGSPTSAPRTSS